MTVDQIVAYFAELPVILVYGILFGAAFVEYVFPPLPGDTVSFAGVALVASFGWSLGLVFLVASLGSVAGAATAWTFGRWLVRRAQRSEWASRHLQKLERGFELYRRHGLRMLYIHRFFFGFRGTLCAVAGASALPVRPVAVAATVGIFAWNAALFAIAWTVGANVDRVFEVFENFRFVAFELAVIGVLASLLGVLFWRRSRRLRSAAQVTL